MTYFSLNIRDLFLLVALLGLSACMHGPKVGGACTYKTLIEDVTVTAIHSNYSELSHEHATYQVPLGLFTSAPLIGAEYQITIESITKGSCTPHVVKAIN
ncbi:hypothetical protein [Paraglaciecola sp. 2405UD69-4]|uniref:hypothetical protein n=1 Tax=Paraglaciecola sp. 2405UD69-4 TaxID=3391836 RepID=UPI0039C8D0C1